MRLRDTVTGEEFDLAADVVVNTSGPWTDLTNEALGRPTAYMGGTKGSHIVLDNPELLAATGGREIFFEHEDGRIVLIYPLKGRVMVGTTDLEHDMREPAVCTEAEVDYFFDLIAHVFPAIRGRPLADRLPLLGRAPAAPPRRRRARASSPATTASSGRMSRSARARRCSASSAASGRPSAPSPSTSPTRCSGSSARPARRSTAGLAIGGGAATRPPTTRAGSGSSRTATRSAASAPSELLERYGTRAEALIADDRAASGRTRSRTTRATAAREIAWLARTERVVHLADVVLRRTSIAFTGSAHRAAARRARRGHRRRARLGRERRAVEIAATRALLAERHGVGSQATRPRSSDS